MTRRLPTYSPERIAEVVARQREATPDIHDELLIDYSAIVLTCANADEIAEADAARQVREWMGV